MGGWLIVDAAYAKWSHIITDVGKCYHLRIIQMCNWETALKHMPYTDMHTTHSRAAYL